MLVATGCLAGYWCPAGSATDTENVCPAGSECPAGHNAAATACQPGYYMPYELSASCWLCPAGTYCAESGTTAPTLCPAGYYCPEGTPRDPVANPTEHACPAGYESDLIGLSEVGDCQKCTHGRYCGSVASTVSTADCLAGYWCYGNQTHPVNNPTSRECAAGTYCP